MGILKTDLYRSFVIGFALGAIGLVVAVGAEQSQRGLADQVIPSAEAAPALPDQTR